MKTNFKISPSFPIPAKQAKELAWFAIAEANKIARKLLLPIPATITFRMTTTKRLRSGCCQMNNRRKNKWFDPRPVIRLAADYGATGIVFERYHRYADSPSFPCDGIVEGYLHLVAHEMGHGICGFEGDKTGELQCEAFAGRCVEQYRLNTQDPANMI